MYLRILLQILQGICDKANDYEEKDDSLNTLRRTYDKGVENGLDAITGKSTLKEVIIHVSNCDEIGSRVRGSKLLRIWHEDCSKPDVENGIATSQFQVNNEKRPTQDDEARNVSAKELLKRELLSAGLHNPTEYAINIVSKTVKCDDKLSKRYILCRLRRLVI